MPKRAPHTRTQPARPFALTDILIAYQARRIAFADASAAIERCFLDRADDVVGNPPFPWRLVCLHCGHEFESVVHPLVNTECCSQGCLDYMLTQNFGAYATRIAENHLLMAVIVTELLVMPSLNPATLLGRAQAHSDLIYGEVFLCPDGRL